MIELVDIYDEAGQVSESSLTLLYKLLHERTPDQSISHKRMPTFEEHEKFIESNPYEKWYFIVEKEENIFKIIGSIYLTDRREVGISIFNIYQKHGYGSKSLELLMAKHPGKFLANINPKNTPSIRFFKKFGAKHIQNTYEF